MTVIRVLGVVAVIFIIGAIFSFAAYALMTSVITSRTETVGTGNLDVTIGAAGTATNRLTIASPALDIGDTYERSFTLTHVGTVNLANVKLTTASAPSTALTTDTTNGLQLKIDRCSVAWTESGASPDYTYTCSGTTTIVLAQTSFIQASTTLSNLNIVSAGNATDNLRAVISLPASATGSMQNLSPTLSFTFLATQRAATAR